MKLRKVEYADEAACIADVERLSGGCRCFHLSFPIEQTLGNPDPTGEPTAQQKQMQGFIDQVIANGWPTGMNSPKEMSPPPDPGRAAVDTLLASLRKLEDKKSGRVNAFLFGPIETAKLRQFMLIHAAHHLSFFEPV